MKVFEQFKDLKSFLTAYEEELLNNIERTKRTLDLYCSEHDNAIEQDLRLDVILEMINVVNVALEHYRGELNRILKLKYKER